MRDLIRQMIDRTQRTAERSPTSTIGEAVPDLAAEMIRVARVATALHLAESARRLAAAAPDEEPVNAMRETIR